MKASANLLACLSGYRSQATHSYFQGSAHTKCMSLRDLLISYSKFLGSFSVLLLIGSGCFVSVPSQLPHAHPSATTESSTSDAPAAGSNLKSAIAIDATVQPLAAAGNCVEINLVSQADDRTLAAVAEDTTLLLASNVGGNFYDSSDAACQGDAITSVILAKNQSSVRAYFRDTHAGTVNFNISDATHILAQATAVLVITPGTPASILVFSGSNQTVAVGTGLSSPFVAVVLDTFNNSVPNITVNWAVLVGSAILSSSSSATNLIGAASNGLTLGGAAEANTITASVSTSAGGASVTFSATGVANAPAVVDTIAPSAPTLALNGVAAISNHTQVPLTVSNLEVGTQVTDRKSTRLNSSH